LQANSVDAARLNDETLNRLWARVNSNERFVVSLNDLRAGRALEAGRKEPLTSKSNKEEKPKRANRKSENRN